MISLKLTKSDYKLIWMFCIFCVIWLSLKFWTEKHPINQILFDIPIIMVKTLAGFFMVRWLIQKYIIEKRQYFLFFILATLALISTGFVDLLRDYLGSGSTWSELPSLGYIIIHSFYYSAGDLGVPFIIIIAKKYFENQAKLATVQERQKETELKLLRSQLSPHFLFNNLNTLDALIDSDPEKAKTYVAKLSSLYRYLISSKDNEIVSLKDEIAMSRDYFYLIKTRFGDAYTFTINIEEDLIADNLYLPTGALQNLLENVVKHNKVLDGKAIDTTLTIKGEDLIVTNTKNNIEGDQNSLGTGLRNLKERYTLLADKVITVINEETYFCVKAPLLFLLETKN